MVSKVKGDSRNKGVMGIHLNMNGADIKFCQKDKITTKNYLSRIIKDIMKDF